MLSRLWRYIRGYLIVSAEGKGTERLVNLAIARGINFWDFKKNRRGATFKIPARSFRKVRPLVRKSRSRVRISRRAGLPFILKKIRRRKGFAWGLVIFLAALYVSSLFVWFIEIDGLVNITEDEILRLAESVGIKRGVYKGNLDLNRLEGELARLHREITWVGLSFRGTKLRVEVAEHLPEPKVDEQPTDITAEKDGLILKVLVIEGKATVAPGDIVSRGDLLIEGIEDYGEFPPEEAKPRKVRARGEVIARVWYEAREPIITEETSRKPTGKKQSRICFLYRGKEYRVIGPGKAPYREYGEETSRWGWTWRNISLPVELVIITYNELHAERRSWPPEEAVRKAGEAAKKSVLKQLPEGAIIERLFCEEHRDDGSRKMRAIVETRENIASQGSMK